MNVLRIGTIVVLAGLMLQACSYTLKHREAVDGKKYWIRHYKDYRKQEQFEDKCVFNKWKRDPFYWKYQGNMESDTTHGSTYIQFDSVRVYLFNGTDRFKSIFTSGLISGQLLYCKMNSSCQPVEGLRLTNAETSEPIVEDLWGWTGHTITIDYFEELKNVQSKPTQRKFKFWVYPFKIRFNGANNIFLLELTNDDADRKTDLETFIKGARVTFLANARTMI